MGALEPAEAEAPATPSKEADLNLLIWVRIRLFSNPAILSNPDSEEL